MRRWGMVTFLCFLCVVGGERPPTPRHEGVTVGGGEVVPAGLKAAASVASLLLKVAPPHNDVLATAMHALVKDPSAVSHAVERVLEKNGGKHDHLRQLGWVSSLHMRTGEQVLLETATGRGVMDLVLDPPENGYPLPLPAVPLVELVAMLSSVDVNSKAGEDQIQTLVPYLYVLFGLMLGYGLTRILHTYTANKRDINDVQAAGGVKSGHHAWRPRDNCTAADLEANRPYMNRKGEWNQENVFLQERQPPPPTCKIAKVVEKMAFTVLDQTPTPLDKGYFLMSRRHVLIAYFYEDEDNNVFLSEMCHDWFCDVPTAASDNMTWLENTYRFDIYGNAGIIPVTMCGALIARDRLKDDIFDQYNVGYDCHTMWEAEQSAISEFNWEAGYMPLVHDCNTVLKNAQSKYFAMGGKEIPTTQGMRAHLPMRVNWMQFGKDYNASLAKEMSGPAPEAVNASAAVESGPSAEEVAMAELRAEREQREQHQAREKALMEAHKAAHAKKALAAAKSEGTSWKVNAEG